MKKVPYILLILFGLYSCQNANKKGASLLFQSENIDTDNTEIIEVDVEKNDFQQLGTVLRTASYVKLAPEPLLSTIKEIRIDNERIYAHDSMSRVICYDMEGKVVYEIDAKGAGPGEYVNVNSFTINNQTKELIIYDNLKLSLLYYDLINGKHLKTEKFSKPNPTAIACIDGVYFYDNRYHNNYSNDSTLHYSLLVSKDGINIGQRYFAHNDAESQYHFSPSPQTFSYNDSSLYYCRNFDNTVYQLNSNYLKSIYVINLPNPLPYSKIENKTNEWELIKSSYSLGLDHVYKCGKLLHFQFSKDGYLISTLYDLSKKEQIYCGRKMEDQTNDSVPLFRLIDGVYKGAFLGILSPESIDYAKSKRQDKLPEIFRQYNPETDNPIIAFYEVI